MLNLYPPPGLQGNANNDFSHIAKIACEVPVVRNKVLAFIEIKYNDLGFVRQINMRAARERETC
jgi:hypothetical protein